ncbi:ATP-binding protein [Sphingomonas tabacisoli]|uniref:histidine kinase n=1 Tax=Sphingomonas tabacisoli TaxID=2249466 RepID=A0ABW4I5K2_9SPHN
MSLLRSSPGLIGRLVALLLLTTLVEFGISALLYERASHFSVRDDEARRLAEHLVIAERLLSERPLRERPSLATELTTDRYLVRWSAVPPKTPSIAPALDGMRRQVLAWEPRLNGMAVRLWLVSPGRSPVVAGILRLPDQSWLSFQTLHPVSGLNLATERILLALIPALGLMLLGGLLVRLVLQPLRQLAVAADKVGHGGQAHVPERGPEEVATVIRAFNRMQERIHQLIDNRTQALAAVGHDLRTPLARLRLRAEAIDPGAQAAIATDISEMEAMIESLLAYLGGENDPETPARTDIAILCATLADDASDRGHDVTYEGPVHFELTVRPLGLKRAVANLIDNAVHHGSHVVVRLAETPARVTIAVEDDGPGLPDDMRDEVTKPFVRLDTARPRDTIGFGLGLAIVTRAVEREGGRLSLRNRPEGGLSAEIVLKR